MIITATTTQRFEVSKKWMEACGLTAYSNIFEVERIEDLMPGMVMVTLRSSILGHGGSWVVNQRRGKFID